MEGFKLALKFALGQNNEVTIRLEHVTVKYISKFTLNTNKLFTSIIANYAYNNPAIM
jgi:hypothetical protein